MKKEIAKIEKANKELVSETIFLRKQLRERVDNLEGQGKTHFVTLLKNLPNDVTNQQKNPVFVKFGMPSLQSGVVPSRQSLFY